jgi:hypothetical protein
MITLVMVMGGFFACQIFAAAGGLGELSIVSSSGAALWSSHVLMLFLLLWCALLTSSSLSKIDKSGGKMGMM